MADWIIEPADSQSPESFGEQVKRVGIGTGIRGLQGIEGLADLIWNNAPHPSEALKERFNLTPEYLEPRNFGENLVQRFGSSAPFTAALGGVPALGSLVLGSGAGALLGSVGLPEGVQDVGQVATELLGGRLASDKLGKVINRFPGVSEKISKGRELAKASVYPNKADFLIDKGGKVVKSTEANKIVSAMKEVGNRLHTETDSKISQSIQHTLEKLGENIVKNKIDPATAIDLRKSLYRQASKLPSSVSSDYISPLTKGINNFFAEYAVENPKFWKHLKPADQLTEMKHMKSYIGEALSGSAANIPGGNISKALKLIAEYPIGKFEKFARTLIGNPAGRKHYFDIFKGLSKNDPLLITQGVGGLINQFSNIFGQLSQGSEEQLIPESSKWIIE
jgi:hypothetical protein